MNLPGLSGSTQLSNPETINPLNRSTTHQFEQSLQVLPVGVLNHNPTLPTTGDHPNPGIESVAESPFNLQNARIPCWRFRIVDRLQHWILNPIQAPYKILDLPYR